MNRLLLVLCIAAFLSVFSCSNSAVKELHVVNSTYNLDTIIPSKEFINVEYKVVNNTKGSWFPDTAYSNCECISVFLGTEAVKPGDTFTVIASLYSRYLEGAINKTITVKTGLKGGQANLQFSLTGYVDITKLSIEERYPYAQGSLLFKTTAFNFGQVLQGKIADAQSEVYNNGDYPVSFTAIGSLPSFVRFDFFPRTINPGESAIIKAKYNAHINPAIGETILAMDIITASDTIPKIPIKIVADVMEDFSLLSEEEKQNAPKVVIEDTKFDYGEITEGDIVEHEFKFTNAGGRDLIFHKMETGCGCTIASIDKGVLKPGESTFIKAVFDSKNKEGNIRIYIRVITNDPEKPYTELMVDGKVLPKN